MRTSANVLFCIIVLTLSACGGGSFEKRLSALDSVLKDKPDSVYELLLGMEEEAIMQKKSNRMYYELLRADAQNKAYVDFTTDSVMKIVADYYDRHGSANEQMRAHYLLGCTYRDLNSAPRALEEMRTAKSKADTISAECDWYTLMLVNSQMANIFRLQKLYDFEEDALNDAITCCLACNDTLNSLLFEENINEIFFLRNDYEETLNRALATYDKYISHSFIDDGKLSLNLCIKACIALGKYTDAKKYIDLYESSDYITNNQEIVKGNLGPLHIFKGQYYNGINNTDSAEYFFRKAFIFGDCENIDIAVYNGLTEVFNKKHNPDSICKYSKLLALAAFAQEKNIQDEEIIHAKALYEYNIERQIAEEKTLEASKTKNYLVLLIAFLIISILTIVHIRYRTLMKKEATINELKLKYQTSLNRLQNTERQLYSLMLNNAESDSLKQENQRQLATLRSQVESYRKRISEILSSRKGITLQETAIVRRIKEYCKNSCYEKMQDCDWESLADTIEYVYPGFYNKLCIQSQLTENEYRLCMLTLCEISPSEIGFLLKKSEKYSSTAKPRILKKVFGETGTTKDFDKRLRILSSDLHL